MCTCGRCGGPTGTGRWPATCSWRTTSGIPRPGVPTAKVIHNFGRVEKVDRAGLARLVASISRFLDPAAAVAAAGGAEVQVLDSRRLGCVWTLDRIWQRLGIGAAIRTAAAGRRLDGQAVERVVFALVAQRACEPASKLAGLRHRRRLRGHGLPAGRATGDRRADLRYDREPAQPGLRRRLR